MSRIAELKQILVRLLNFLTPKVEDTDKVRRGYLLNILITTYGVLFGLSLPVVLFSAKIRFDFSPLLVVLTIVVFYVLMALTLFLSLKSQISLAGYFFVILVLTFDVASYLVIKLTPTSLTGANVANLYILVVMATLALGPRGGIITALLCNLAMFMPTFLNDTFGKLGQLDQDNGLAVLRLHSVYLLGVSLLIAASFHAIQRTVIAVLNRQNLELKKVNAQLQSRQVKDGELSETLVKLAQQLSQISAIQTSRVSEQAHYISDVSSTLAELSRTAKQMSGVARSVLAAAQDTSEVARQNGQAVTQSAKDFGELKAYMDALASISNELYGQSEKVGQVMDFLNDVADETHLLGINATIEASEAGAFGKRFGVVAAEVQSLADRSRRSTQQVKFAVQEVKVGIDQCFQLTAKGLDKATQTALVAEEAGKAITKIVENADNSAMLAETISSVSTQQQSATSYVANMIKELEINARETVVQTQQIAQTAAILLDNASLLKQMHLSDQAKLAKPNKRQLPPSSKIEIPRKKAAVLKG